MVSYHLQTQKKKWINENRNKISCRKNLQNFRDDVVLSGELTGLGDLLLDSIHRVLNLSCFSGTVRDLKLEFSRLDKYDTARGAAILMRNLLLRN